jgi:hypothetical protein
MKALLALTLSLFLVGCISTGIPKPTPTANRDWSKFERPPAGTPCMLRVFNVVGPRRYEVVDLPGKFSEPESEFDVEFPNYRLLSAVFRVELHFRGEVISVRRFNPPTVFSKGEMVGWRK